MSWQLTDKIKSQILSYAAHKQTSISIRQMVKFGPNPSPGSIFLALNFIVNELAIRLAKKVKDLDNAPFTLASMPSTIKVRNWYAQSFEELINIKKPVIDANLLKLLDAEGNLGLSVNTNSDTNSIENFSESESPSDDSDDGVVVKHRSSSTNSSSTYSSPSSVSSNISSGVFGTDNSGFDFTTNSDDGVVLKHKGNSEEYKDSETSDDGFVFRQRDATKEIDDTESPTYGLKYYTPTPNIVWPKQVYDYNKIVNDALMKIKKRHDATVATMAQGVQEWKSQNKKTLVNSQIQGFLDRFYMSRIGIRMLIGQHIALNMAQQSPTKQRISQFLGTSGGNKSNYVGVICTDCNVSEIAQDAIETASYICEDFYGLIEGPEIQLISPNHDIQFMYVPGHLIHMLFETLKNSLRATIETHTPKLKQKMIDENPKLTMESIDINDLKFPPIKVIISEGSEDIAIKVSDEGGGIPISQIPLIWTYLYTTVDETPVLEDGTNSSFKAPMAGFGYGLPISRLYAQYFGGDLKLISMEGYGTDVYLHLNRLSSSSEPLP